MIITSYLIILISIFFVIQYICGLLVQRKGIKVNYTRKLIHFALFFLPFFLEKILLSDSNPTANGLGMLASLSTHLLYFNPIRSRIGIINTAFMGLDRPEDRPNTLKWLFTQNLLASFVMGNLSFLLTLYSIENLIYIPIFINAIGDGLAEPIGIRFGRHKYQTRALFSKQKYTRSLEGSAAVFITSIVMVIVYTSFFTQIQFIILLATLPLLMTIGEAISPHTLDNPFLYLICGIILLIVIQI